MGRALLVVALCGCGRFGFDLAAPDDVTPDTPTDTIKLTVRFGDRSQNPGSPVVGARVVLDDNSVHHTDAAGVLELPAATARTIHVVHPSELTAIPNSFRLLSLYDVPPGARIELGSRPVPVPGIETLSVSTANDAGANGYSLFGPADCGTGFDQGATPSFTWTFGNQCEGATGELFLMSFNSGAAQNQASTGPVTFTNNGTLTFGAYSSVTFSTATVRNIPDSFGTVFLRGIAIAGPHRYDLTNNSGAPSDVTRSFGVSTPLPMKITHALVTLLGAAATSSVRVIGPLDGNGDIDAADAPPLMGPPSASPTTRTFNWGMPAPSADLVRATVDIAGTERVLWTIYAPPTQRNATFPDLPGDLAALIPPTDATWNSGDAIAIDTGVVTATDALKLVDVEILDLLNARLFPNSPVFLQQTSVPP